MGEPVKLKVVSGQQTSIKAWSTDVPEDAATVEVIPKTADAFVVVHVSPEHWPFKATKVRSIVEATGLTVLVVPHGMEFEVMTIDNESAVKAYESRKVGEIVDEVDFDDPRLED